MERDIILTEDEKRILENYEKYPYNSGPYEEGEGTFRKHKLKGKRMEKRKGYHLNTYTYELEEIK